MNPCAVSPAVSPACFQKRFTLQSEKRHLTQDTLGLAHYIFSPFTDPPTFAAVRPLVFALKYKKAAKNSIFSF